MNTAYSAATDWLFGTQYRGVKLGLENIRTLLKAMGEPQNALRFIHVAGTNGKGSVCAMVDSICRTAGIKTGLFTSPHLVRFSERIQINGLPIDDADFVQGIQRIRALIDEEQHPTFFEITTAWPSIISEAKALISSSLRLVLAAAWTPPMSFIPWFPS